ncbi:unnamed protein product [Orchesella dallaii]|uniref:Uncharacterized protein n=1 Tax=Orchesella dallaii TaxID=48710 RepID=A0ABP1QPX4_9HEXA
MAKLNEWVLFASIGITLVILTLADAKSVQIRTGKPPRVQNYRPTSQGFKRNVGRRRQVVATKTTPTPKVKENAMIKSKQGESATNADPLQSAFDSGFKRFFEFLKNTFIASSEGAADIADEKQEESGFRIPGLPTTPLFHSFDATSIIKLIENTDDSEFGNLAESAIVDTVSQLVGIIGFDDLREWLGIILMYFVLGPIMVPLFWLPISLFGMAGLLAPLFYFNPPSKLNTNVMGHDPIKPESDEGAERSINNLSQSDGDEILNLFSNFNQELFRDATHNNMRSREASNDTSSTVKVLEGCVERLSCHLTRVYRDNPVSNWLTSRLNTTKVEWARRTIPESDDHFATSPFEDCTKYACSIFPAVRSFISEWNGNKNTRE